MPLDILNAHSTTHKSVTLCNDPPCVKVCVGDIAFEAVPPAVLLNFPLADSNFDVPADFKKLVISPPIDLLLGDAPAFIGLFLSVQHHNCSYSRLSLHVSPSSRR